MDTFQAYLPQLWKEEKGKLFCYVPGRIHHSLDQVPFVKIDVFPLEEALERDRELLKELSSLSSDSQRKFQRPLIDYSQIYLAAFLNRRKNDSFADQQKFFPYMAVMM